jgi:hypothetical protein
VSLVITWPRPFLHRPSKCDAERCACCENGFAVCEVCGGAEGDLPDDCPGRRISLFAREEIMAERLNYVFPFGWVKPGDRQFRSNSEPRSARSC